MERIQEECGVFGVYSKEVQNLASMTYYGLYALQHRGQDGCGIVVNDGGVFTAHKDLGLVGEVFTKERLAKLGVGKLAVGHVRAGVKGTNTTANTQPLVVNHVKGTLAIAYNGSLINKDELRTGLELEGSIFHSTGATEVIAYEIIKERLKAPSIEHAVVKAMNNLKGAYCIVVMSPTKLIAARDPLGFRPLCYGQTEDGSYVVASESCALDAVGAKLIRSVKPGEVVVFDAMGVRSIEEHCGKVKPSSCIFEFVYNARPDSVIDGYSVHEARVEMGRYLARKYPVKADVVISVPDSGNDAAVGYAKESGIPFEMGFLKNKYIGRTFIFPDQKDREDQVRKKLNPIASVVNGKRVIMVDDSIVRGTTSGRVVNLLREAGATEVHFMVSSPPFLYPCYYGTDIKKREDLIANNHTVEEIRQMVGVDTLGYLDLEDLKKIALMDGQNSFCYACFDGKYSTEIPVPPKPNKYEQKIDIVEKTKRHL
ncbi:MAG: amidophosphoribosyltransferase [Clostridiales bacterium]|nr:amidophosphoribosyltransferase [Clostridiales bacterium]